MSHNRSQNMSALQRNEGVLHAEESTERHLLLCAVNWQKGSSQRRSSKKKKIKIKSKSLHVISICAVINTKLLSRDALVCVEGYSNLSETLFSND